jgi:hypothetical protein
MFPSLGCVAQISLLPPSSWLVGNLIIVNHLLIAKSPLGMSSLCQKVIVSTSAVLRLQLSSPL